MAKFDHYKSGQEAAREAQEALAAGKDWGAIGSELHLTDPDDAAGILESWERDDPQSVDARWWKGYLSRWD